MNKGSGTSESRVPTISHYSTNIPMKQTGQLSTRRGGNARKLATELKISAEKNETRFIASTVISYENMPFVPLLK